MKKIIFLFACLLAVFTYQKADAQEIRIFKKNNTVIRVTYAELDSIVSVGYYEEKEFVDLGLSVKWASCNLGAKSPEDYGDYYAWGETTPKESYTEENCLTSNKEMSDISGNPKYDAATANCGKGVRLPTKAEFQELIDNTTITWTEQNGVEGRLFISNINGNSIFLPAAGYRTGTGVNNAGRGGEYWSSTPRENSYDGAYCLSIYWDEFYLKVWFFRRTGYSVRPVQDK